MNAPTNTRAKSVKLVSFLCIVAGLLGWIIGFAVDSDPAIMLGALGFFAGFFGFVVGRFME